MLVGVFLLLVLCLNFLGCVRATSNKPLRGTASRVTATSSSLFFCFFFVLYGFRQKDNNRGVHPSMHKTVKRKGRHNIHTSRRSRSGLGDGIEGAADDGDALAHVRLGQDQRRRKANRLVVRRLGEQAVVAQRQAHVPSYPRAQKRQKSEEGGMQGLGGLGRAWEGLGGLGRAWEKGGAWEGLGEGRGGKGLAGRIPIL